MQEVDSEKKTIMSPAVNTNILTYGTRYSIVYVGLEQGYSTRGPRAACGPWASFMRPGKDISQNTMRYEY